MKSLGGSEEAPCRLPTAPPLSLRQLCGGLLSGASVSCTPLWPTVPCLLAASPAPLLAHSPRADSRVLCLDQPSGFPCSARRHPLKGGICTLE